MRYHRAIDISLTTNHLYGLASYHDALLHLALQLRLVFEFVDLPLQVLFIGTRTPAEAPAALRGHTAAPHHLALLFTAL